MRPDTFYHVEFERAGDTPTRSVFRCDSELDVLVFSTLNLMPGSELFVACLGAGVDHGNLAVDIDAQGQATVIAHEHRGFIAEGLTVAVAVDTLKYWLPLQQRTSAVQWQSQ